MAWLKRVFIYIQVVLYIMKHPEKKKSEILVLTVGSTTATTTTKTWLKYII